MKKCSHFRKWVKCYRVFGLLIYLWLACFVFGDEAGPHQGGGGLNYTLEKSGFVTLAVDDSGGTRVRNLLASAWREAGLHTEWWDGLDDAGEPMPSGDYRWKGLIHQGVRSYFHSAFNSPGNPPWLTTGTPRQQGIREGGSGGWLSDHALPMCAYADEERVYFGSEIAEAGHSIMELDLEGNKKWGTLWLGLSGASAIAVDGDILYVAGEKGWMKDSLAMNRLDRKTHRWIPNPAGEAFRREEPAFIKVKSSEFSGIRGMVVTQEWIVLSLADRNRLACFSVKDGSHIKDVSLPGAGALAKLPDGSVLAVSGDRVVRVDFENAQHEEILASGVTQPGGLAVDSKGNILIGDMAPDAQCVKIFSPAGKLLGVIGKPGGRGEGAFDPLAMSLPRAITVDAKDHVWVAEESFLPKRISLWNMDGTLLRDWIGPSYYGGGGALDPHDATRSFYKGMEFANPPWPERSTLKAVLFQPQQHKDLPWPSLDEAHAKGELAESNLYGQLPQAPVYRGDRLYLLGDEGYGVRGILIGEVVDDHLVPRVIFGSYAMLWHAWKELHPEFVQGLSKEEPEKNAAGVFLWQDLNGDGRAEPAEVSLAPDWQFGAMWAMRSYPSLDFHARRGGNLIALSPESGDGPLRYNLKNAREIPLPKIARDHGVSAVAPDGRGNLLVNCGGGESQGDPTNVFLSIAPDGNIRWTYPNPYPANWHNSPRSRTVDIQHTLNVEGIVSLEESQADVFQLNGNKGVRYLITTDGLFVSSMYGDMRTTPSLSSLKTAEPGQRVDEFSLMDECFSGWFGRTTDGRIWQVLGKDSSNVMEVRGLESLRRLSGGTVTLVQSAQAAAAGQSSVAGPVRAVQLGGISKGWEKLAKYALPPLNPIANFAFGWQSDALLLSVEVEKNGPFTNLGNDFKTLFKSGDAVDLRLAVDRTADPKRTAPVPGDLRIIFAMLDGKPVAVRYRFVIPDTPESSRTKFASPTGVAEVDEISIMDKVDVKIENTPTGYHLRARIPWESLRLPKAPAGELRGDLGVIVADQEGARSVARYYYFDQTSQVVSDLPSEVRVNPSQWGIISF